MAQYGNAGNRGDCASWCVYADPGFNNIYTPLLSHLNVDVAKASVIVSEVYSSSVDASWIEHVRGVAQYYCSKLLQDGLHGLFSIDYARPGTVGSTADGHLGSGIDGGIGS